MLEEILKGLAQKLVEWAVQYPAVAAIIAVLTCLKYCMPPLMEIAHRVVLATPGKGDDEFLENLEVSTAYKYFLYALEWLTGVETPTLKALKAQKEIEKRA